jgi:hypothetical protein
MIAKASIIHKAPSTSRRKQPMLIKVNNTIINVANIVSAHFTPATEMLKGALTIICVNNVDPASSLGRILLEGDEAVQVWDVLSQDADALSPI